MSDKLTPEETAIIRTIREIEFGAVTVRVQDGRIVNVRKEETVKMP